MNPDFDKQISALVFLLANCSDHSELNFPKSLINGPYIGEVSYDEFCDILIHFKDKNILTCLFRTN